MDWVTNLCNCFSPEMRKSIIGYLSASNLNRQVIQQEKCTQQIQDKDQQSIYEYVKTKSYYNIHGDDHEHQFQKEQQINNQLEFQNELDPNWYPKSNLTLDEIYEYKHKALKHILQSEITQEYQKVYDSQDDNKLVIYVKNQLQNGKKFNSYRFTFNVPNSDTPSIPKDYINLETFNQQGKSLIESLLKSRQLLKTTQKNLQICYRTYEKKLVISQHDFVTAEKTILQQQIDDQLSTEGNQIYNTIAYTTIFSVKGVRDQKSVVYNRGHINLCGLRLFELNIPMIQEQPKQNQKQKQLKVSGYLNVELDTPVNPNMLKQPVAKEIRVLVQKLICLLQNSDAI